jgi:hypothetical protein
MKDGYVWSFILLSFIYKSPTFVLSVTGPVVQRIE